MKIKTFFIALGLAVCMVGCGNNDASTDDGLVQVEIEKINNISPVASLPDAVEEVDVESVDGIDVSGEMSEGTDLAEAVETTETGSDADNAEVGDDAANAETSDGVQTTGLPDDFVKDASALYVAVVGDTPREILEIAKEELEWQDVKLEIVDAGNFEYSNDLVATGKVDASLCVNKAYMDSYNTIHGTNLSILKRGYFEPFAIFPAKTKSLAKCPNGAVVAVPQGDIAVARSLHLLEQKGIIGIKDGASYQAGVGDINSNPHNIKIETYDSSAGKPSETAYDYIITDLNHAIIYEMDQALMLGYENRNSNLLDLFTVNLVTTSGNKDNQKLQKLQKALSGEKVSSYMKESYLGAVINY